MKPLTVSVRDASEAVGVSQDVIRNLIRAGELDTCYLGARVLIRYASLEAYVNALPAERTA